MPWVAAKVHLVLAFRDIERLSQLPGAGAKSFDIINSAPLPHQFNPTPRLNCPDEDKSVARPALYQNI
jgi:hypothetical protein